MLIVLLVLAVILWSGLLAAVVRADGRGWRPAPRSHAEELVDDTWPR